jgi:hypothetical protein
VRSRYPDSSAAERVVALLTELADILASERRRVNLGAESPSG